PLADIAAGDGSAVSRLRTWLRTLAGTKRGLRREDPEIFATYFRLVGETRGAVAAHEAALAAQLGDIIGDGVASGEFAVENARRCGWAVFRATARFHHPLHAAEWDDPDIAAELDDVCSLLLDGLRGR
ncbi:MAG: TetR/AcrR family transcriptional regulator, partial [Stackebrandtia sp.]